MHKQKLKKKSCTANHQRLSVQHCHPVKAGASSLAKQNLADKDGGGIKALQITIKSARALLRRTGTCYFTVMPLIHGAGD